jgi:alpha-L-rhamnosidase
VPRLSWQLREAPPNYVQQAYEVELKRNPWGTETATESYEVTSQDQVLVPWPAEPLRSQERAEVRVRVRGDGAWSAWSEPAAVEAGLLHPEDWTARWVAPREIGALGKPAPSVGVVFDVPGGVARARLHLSAHGWYEARLNNAKVTDDYFGPGWTVYQSRIRYYSYDVTMHLHTGTNHLDILLGNGWWRGHLSWARSTAVYGDRLAALVQLEIQTFDGQLVTVNTDNSWTARPTHVLSDDMYDGQTTDLRKPLLGDPPSPVDVLDDTLENLVAAESEPVRVVDILPGQKVWRSPCGKLLVDFGQNVVGFARIRPRGLQNGQQIVVRHAEVLENEELGVRPLRSAKAVDTYYASGSGEDALEPRFTFHGFRYVQVDGVDDLPVEDVEALVLSSDLERTGWFECSDDLVNQLHRNVFWGMRGNFVDIPTDCPQRDERLGWTGDIQVFSPTALYLEDAAGFLSSWLADLAAEQHEDGTVPMIVPDPVRKVFPGAAWGDAATVIPWNIYLATGDAEVLRRQLPSMTAWVDKITSVATDHLWLGGFQFGDWLDPDAPPDRPGQAKADPDVVATACYYRSADLVAKAATVVGELELAGRYADLAEDVRRAYLRRFVTEDGRILSDSSTVYAQAICWEMLGPEQRRLAGDRLAELARNAAFRISTGFVGTPLVTEALSLTGHTEIAYRLLLERGCPSWLYPVTMGATTIWERWDSMLPDGTINPGEMTSFNHYALGAVADWLHRRVGGLRIDDPGYHRILLAPEPGEAIRWAHTRHNTPFGEASVSWSVQGETLTVKATVPVGTTATVRLPGYEDASVGHGEHHWETRLPPSPDRPITTIRDVIDNPQLWEQVCAAVAEADVRLDAKGTAERLSRLFDSPADQLAEAITFHGMLPGGEALKPRIARILAMAATMTPSETSRRVLP